MVTQNINDEIINLEKEEDLQLAENADIEKYEIKLNEYQDKRELLRKTKITRHTWSILDLYRKINEKYVILDPDYQRRVVWKDDKKTAFIESLYMGIMIPPIYVVEVPSDNLLSKNKYEVVDGKQRLTAITMFLNGELKLNARHLEYFSDIFGGKNFNQIEKEYKEITSEMLSGVLDIYVITKNSPEFTKYDIFSRLNKGAEPLKTNEIRRAIYRSYLTERISKFVEIQIETNKEGYDKKFSEVTIQRYEDFGRFFRSIGFYVKSNLEKLVVEKYNSRPREMINSVLQDIQNEKIILETEIIDLILTKTLEMMDIFDDVENKDYYIDACIPFVNKWDKLISKIEVIKKDREFLNTFIKSSSTTSNVNARLRRVSQLLED